MTRPTPSERLARAVSVLWLGLCAALWAGTLQAAITLFDQYARDRVAYASRDVAWMAQLSYAALALPLALLLAAVAIFVGAARWVAVALFGAGAVFSLLLPYGGVARWASLVLAFGVGVAFARAAAANPERFARMVRRQTLALVGVSAAAALVVLAGRPLRERLAISSLPEAAGGAPNVLLLILDTVRAASVSLNGYEKPTTPRLEALAAQSVTFDHAFSTAPWTLPSHASMFTGRYADELSADYVHALDDSDSTLAEIFAARGYLTAGFVANHNYTGFDSGLARGFQRYEDYKRTLLQVWRTSWPVQALLDRFPDVFDSQTDSLERADYLTGLRLPPDHWTDLKRADEVTREFLAWREQAGNRPYFAFLNYFDAHKPRYAPFRVRRQFRDQRPIRDRYNAAINYLDETVGALLDTLAQRGELERTIVVVTSDHGELFGERGIWGHANNLYLNVLHVPMLVRYPAELPGGRRVAAPVSLRDLGATVLDLAGVRGVPFPGVSLGPLARGDDSTVVSPVRALAHRTINLPMKFPASRGSLHAAIDHRMHYIRNSGDGSEELFDWRADTAESNDLAKTLQGAKLLPAYREVAGVPPGAGAPQERP
jgi:arylsulfatase A-like enzyme